MSEQCAHDPFSLSARLKSFGHAFLGGRTLLATQPNAVIHLVATVLVVIAGFYFRVRVGDWIVLCLVIALVWVAEALNTAIEFLADEITLEKRERIKRAKYVAAFGVLVAALAAVFVGLLVFYPYVAMADHAGGFSR